MRMHFGRLTGALVAGLVLGMSSLGSTSGCSSQNNPPALDAGKDTAMMAETSTSCGSTVLTPADEDYGDPGGCSSCKFAAGADPSTCTPARNVNACCAWVQDPSATLVRAEGLHYYSVSTDSPVDFSCLTPPMAPTPGTPHMGTLTGFVKIFSSYPASGTVGVTVTVYTVDTTTGALGTEVGTNTTTMGGTTETNNWLNNCTGSPCVFQQYTIPNVPTETPLVIKTSDGTGTGTWADLYDYDIYFADTDTCSTTPPGAPCVSSTTTWATSYDVTAVVPDDINTAAETVGLTPLDPSQGVIAGEVHDCGDIRIQGANVDTDQGHDGPIFYFDTDESDPLPDETRSPADEGTSDLGLFGTVNVNPGTPIRISAVGLVGGKDTLLGTAVIQVYAGPAVTAVTLRGRRAWQTNMP
jgi:hypothetical protein